MNCNPTSKRDDSATFVNRNAREMQRSISIEMNGSMDQNKHGKKFVNHDEACCLAHWLTALIQDIL